MSLAPGVDPVDVRPRRRWFLVAALTAVGGVLAAAAVLLLLLRSGGALGQPLTPGQPVTVHLSLSNDKMVWIKETGQSIPDVTCATTRADGQEIVESRERYLLPENVELTVDGQRWLGLLTLGAGPTGPYEVTCTTAGTAAPTLSIGDPPKFYGARDTALGTLAAAGLAGVGMLTGLLLAFVVAVRRFLHRARLRQQRTDAQHG
ncbi:hypothetical protein V6V47_20570 [Micromonospora sp. CPCC 205539]|uniref:hypothetical protein n=1 Tax=Micromonospora sp. CPCC 205539 TaxID=3122408 RepID=UPI002FF31E69